MFYKNNSNPRHQVPLCKIKVGRDFTKTARGEVIYRVTGFSEDGSTCFFRPVNGIDPNGETQLSSEVTVTRNFKHAPIVK